MCSGTQSSQVYCINQQSLEVGLLVRADVVFLVIKSCTILSCLTLLLLLAMLDNGLLIDGPGDMHSCYTVLRDIKI